MSPLSKYLGVAQLVARYLGVVEAASSSLVTQTKNGDVSDVPDCSVFSFVHLFAFCFLIRRQSLTYASHTKSCLLLGGRTRRA